MSVGLMEDVEDLSKILSVHRDRKQGTEGTCQWFGPMDTELFPLSCLLPLNTVCHRTPSDFWNENKHSLLASSRNEVDFFFFFTYHFLEPGRFDSVDFCDI